MPADSAAEPGSVSRPLSDNATYEALAQKVEALVTDLTAHDGYTEAVRDAARIIREEGNDGGGTP